MRGPRPIVIIGARGQLGVGLVRRLEAAGRDHRAVSRELLDLGVTDDIAPALGRLSPAGVINAAAFNDVSGADRPDRQAEAFRINRDAPAALASACHDLGIPFVHVSTDYVFDGKLDRPYREDDPPGPLQVYGRSKLEGERAVLDRHPRALVARTSTLYGHGRTGRGNYIDAILAQARRCKAFSVVRLPIASPTYAEDLAGWLLRLLDVGAAGIVHAVNSGAASRLELAREAVRLAGLGGSAAVGEKPAPSGGVPRPGYSVLDVTRLADLIGAPPRPWQQALADYVRGQV